MYWVVGMCSTTPVKSKEGGLKRKIYHVKKGAERDGFLTQ